jgi:hypothetical protein
MRVPIVGEVRLAAGSNLNSGDPLSGVLTPGVEGATCMLSVIELPVAALDNLGDNHQFVESSKGVDTRLQPKVFMIQMNFDTSRKDVGESWWIFTEKASRIAGRIGSQGNLSPQMKKSRKTTNSPSLGVGICSSSGARPAPGGKNPALSYSRIIFVVTFDPPKASEGGSGPTVFTLTKLHRYLHHHQIGLPRLRDFWSR